ncbi:MAG: hypothetical protein NTY63_03660, partial [Candidatus Bipolaricaulota bacterium]|nr:hypothetical protein [Candidatus Bipolaricaulota bacterium]
ALDKLSSASWIRIVTLTAMAFSGVAVVSWMRKRYVTPRLGRAKFSAERARRTRAMRIMLAACVAATVALVALTALSPRLGIELPGDLGAWLIISAVILVPVGGLAVFLDCPRLLVHGGLFVVVEFLHIVVRFPDRVPFGGIIAYGAAACISLTVGISVYIHFLRVVSRPVLVPGEGPEEERRVAN